MVAFDSPSSFLAVTLYLPASSTVTPLISSDAKYEWPSLSICTRWRAPTFTALPLCDQVTVGRGSAWMRHSNSSRLPSSSCRMAGFLANVGAMPSICLPVCTLETCQSERTNTNTKNKQTHKNAHRCSVIVNLPFSLAICKAGASRG